CGFRNFQQLYVIFSVKHIMLLPQRKIAHLPSKISYYTVSSASMNNENMGFHAIEFSQRKQQILSEAVYFVQWVILFKPNLEFQFNFSSTKGSTTEETN
ncbi:hypothetical protein S83_045869, partial [Arachis hypogaea]